MRRRLIAVICIICMGVGGTLAYGVQAQDTPPLGPISTLEAGDFRALAVTANGDRLLVADAENQQVRVYDFTDPVNPVLLTSLDVSGTPVLLAGGEHFGLVAVTTNGPTDAIEVIAPALPGGPYLPGSSIAIGKRPQALALSPNSQWGIAVSDGSYTLLHINTPGDIDSIPEDADLIGAALSNDTAYLLSAGSLDAAPLADLTALVPKDSLSLRGQPSAVALNRDGSAGVVVVDDSELVFFDPANLEQTSTFTLDGSPIISIAYMTQDDTDFLLVMQENSASIRIINPADLQSDTAGTAAAESQLAAPEGSRPLRALATFDGMVIVTDGMTISIFAS